jgi:hypothetical protein
MTTTIRDLQTSLPWTIKYSTDFRGNPQAHKDFGHALHHVGKALGRLHEFVDNMDHDRALAVDFVKNKAEYEKYVADLVVCALRLANTFPGGTIDLERAVVERIESKNGVSLTPDAVARSEPQLRVCKAINPDNPTLVCERAPHSTGNHVARQDGIRRWPNEKEAGPRVPVVT